MYVEESSDPVSFEAGLAHHCVGRLSQAEAIYRQILASEPDHADSLHLLGLASLQVGHPGRALDLIIRAVKLQPGNGVYHSSMGAALRALGRQTEAIASYREALRHKPDFAEAHCDLGAVLYDLSAFAECERCYREALRLKPTFAEAYGNLGGLLIRLGRLDEAEVNLREACKLKPCFPEALGNLGDLLRIRGRPEEAEICCREALRQRPDYVPAQLTLGNALRESDRFHEAEACFRLALDHNPAWPEALNNLGTVLVDLGRPDEAIQCYRTALSQRPDYPEAHANLAIALLLDGQFDEGWREHEWRWKRNTNKPSPRGFSQPVWDGGDIGDRVLLLHAEQGFGDALQFCRFVPAVAARRRVVLEVQPSLVPLLAGLPGTESIVARGDPLPPFDLHCPLLSLPRALGITLETIPREAYLRADPQRVAAWRQRVGQLDGLRVGLVWAGNQTMVGDRRRSIPLERFSQLADMPGVSFVSLQKGPAASQSPPPGLSLHDWTEDLRDFGETAALIEVLDLVISVDTAVVHLAGALGRPVWLLNRFNRCWRWLVNRDDSPWYPTLRQFRQPQPGDWHSVLRNVRAELQKCSLTRSIAQ